MLRLVGTKNNKFWLKSWNEELRTYEFIPEADNEAYWKAERDLFDQIAADIYNKAFNKDSL